MKTMILAMAFLIFASLAPAINGNYSVNVVNSELQKPQSPPTPKKAKKPPKPKKAKKPKAPKPAKKSKTPPKPPWVK